MSTRNTQADQARESGRRHDGRFGPYQALEADLTLMSDVPRPETSELITRLDNVRDDHPDGHEAELKAHADGTCELTRGDRRLHVLPRGEGYQVAEQTFDGEQWALAPEGGVDSYTEDFDRIEDWSHGMLNASPAPEPTPCITKTTDAPMIVATQEEQATSEGEILEGVNIEDIVDDHGAEIGQTANIGDDSVTITRAQSADTNSGYRGYQVNTRSQSRDRDDSTNFFEQLMTATQYSRSMIDEIQADSRQWGEVAY